MVTDPRGQLAGSFSRLLERQAEALVLLADEAAGDGAVLDALRFELERLRGTAAALGIAPVAVAAERALHGIAEGRASVAVGEFLESCKHVDPSLETWSPVVMLGVSAPSVHPYAWILQETDGLDGALGWAGRACAFIAPVGLVDVLLSALNARGWSTPVYAFGPRFDLRARVGAARDGATGYLHEPLDLGPVLARVGTGGQSAHLLPYRVLVVEPDAAAAVAIIGQLGGPDVLVQWLVDGAQILPVLEDFWPEVVLLASNCGGISGGDLLAVLRGHPTFVDVPVLVMTAPGQLREGDPLVRADEILLRAGGQPALLTARVRTWLRRSRSARHGLELDPSTGCLSRAALLRAVERELGLARRAGTPVSMVVLDVDELHEINERAGLVAGDRVLRGLAEVLASTLRRTDLVGRLGADSFGAILPRCSAEDAARRVDALRARFEEWAGGQDLGQPTFSAGIAESNGDFVDILPRASRALGAARRGGGGRTVLAG